MKWRIAWMVFLVAVVCGGYLVLNSGDVPDRSAELLPLVDAAYREAAQPYSPGVTGRLDDLSVAAAEILKQLPGVGKVEVTPIANPARRIVHLCDWHFVPPDLQGIDMENAWGRKLSKNAKKTLHRELLFQVELVQVEQMGLLRCLEKHHGVSTVYLEGLTEEGVPAFEQNVQLLKESDRMLAQLRTQLESVKGKSADLEKEIRGMMEELKPPVLEIGAAARIGLKCVPVEDARLLAEAKPVVGAKIQSNEAKIRKRREAIVSRVGAFGVIVLGGSHDLSELMGKDCEYIRVWTKSHPH